MEIKERQEALKLALDSFIQTRANLTPVGIEIYVQAFICGFDTGYIQGSTDALCQEFDKGQGT